MNRRAAAVLAVVVVATLALSGVALAKTNKFTFEGVELVDGETVVEDAVIEVASKSTKKEELTTCSYFTADYEEYLGQFQGEKFFAKEEGSLAKAFCVNNFENRVE